MGLFSKKNGDSSNAAPANDAAKKSSKKAQSELPKVLNESVWESVHEDLKKNKRFILNDNGQTSYIALLFDTNEIGGLAGKEARKDESKGSIVEAIRTGRIKTYIRMEMLLEDCFVIIPDSETLANMDEFRMLIDATYTLCTVTKDGNISTVTSNGKDDGDEITVTFARIKEFAEGDSDPHTLLTGKVSDMFTGSAVDYDAEDVEDIDDIDDNITESPDDFDAFNAHVNQPVQPTPQPAQPTPKPAPAPAPQPVSQQPVGPAPQPVSQPTVQSQPAPQPANNASAGFDADDQFDFDDTNEDYEDDYEDITEESLKNFVKRKFYSEDLGLEVSTEPFDAQFMHGNAFLQFDTHRGTGFLNEQLSNLAKDANTRMERMHNDNLFRLRERYLKLVQNGCVNIAKILDISTEDTQFGKFHYMIEASRQKNLENVTQAVQPKIKQLEDNWQSILKTVGDQAAISAVAEYKSQYGMTHQRDIDALVSREKDEIERDYQNSMKRLNADRRAEATKLLDILINETLANMSEIYLKCLEEERTEYIRLQRGMTKFLDENRKHEITRIEALSEENRSRNRAEEVRKEYIGKIKAMGVDFEARSTKLKADLNQVRIDRDNELRARRAEWEAKFAEKDEEIAALHATVDDLMKKYADLDRETNEKYQTQITRLENENNDYREQLDHVVDTHKRNSKLAIYLTIAAMIAAIGAGFMFGSIVNIHKTSKIEQDAISQVQQADDDANNEGEQTPPEE